MIDRRSLLLTAAATLAPAPVFAADGSRHDQLNALFDRFVNEGLDRSPEGVTSLGLDVGPRAHQKFELGDRSLKAVDENYDLAVKQLAALEAFGRRDLSPADQVSY